MQENSNGRNDAINRALETISGDSRSRDTIDIDAPPNGYVPKADGGQLGGAKALGGWRRSELRETVLAAIEQFPDDVRAELVQPRFSLKFLAAIEAGLARCDRTAMTIYANAMKLLGEERNLSLTIVNAVGADTGYARGAVDALRRAESASPQDVARAAFEALDAMRGELTLEEYRATLSGAEIVTPESGG